MNTNNNASRDADNDNNKSLGGPGINKRSILLTTPEGSETKLMKDAKNDDTIIDSPTTSTSDLQPPPSINISHIDSTADQMANLSPKTSLTVTADSPVSVTAANIGMTTPTTAVQFDAEEIERGRSRIKNSTTHANVNTNANPNNNTNNNMERSNRRIGGSLSTSRSRSRSRASSRIREEEFLKWTVLRQDPSMRLQNLNENIAKYNKKKKKNELKEQKNLKKKRSETDDEQTEEEEEEEEDVTDTDSDEDDEDDDEDESDEESDEEQVSDIENDVEIDEAFNYDLGMKVLPNFCSSINDILDTAKPWIAKYEESIKGKENEGVNFTTLDGGYIRAMQLLTKGKGASMDFDPMKPAGRCYILYTDLSSESTYALTYMMGAVLNNGDTLYIVHWESSKVANEKLMQENVGRVRKHVMHMFDCVSAVIDDLDVIILSLTHPYPKHLLNEMIHGLKPVSIACSLTIILSTLQNFVCSVPTLVIRKKLKRS
ncbi:Imp21p NDAI_0F00230 [Naumovozyma dairenensis CBS 421]|uniref:Sugar utilization regulatory protein IMP2 n=1 Tax=Naumovozyma dairenensis (strain ATCC 10597 / BCRC 20456 / CBS 421 / NBRC 0211 / NRRL Y-12639) TaxID=1071378 RepID=G0WC31_NAUDC|nr:hypothetical protein NDAI_0F00230 [Naumovozyma dairenensis CBS 421]CCD25342.1 hypothetical protein NDAI_0F00230 [Naumovozyma dairenensis CBS 421]